jgi:GT2 family glycosyltransferase
MPFAGDVADALEALEALRALAVGAGDELIFADNSGVAAVASPHVRVVRAGAEASPAHARNAGAATATRDWILFLDADCRPLAGLLDAFFSEPVADDVGALAGEVVPVPGESLAGRYGAARSFLGQRAHLAHPYLPRAVAANLLVRRAAFEQLGGFFEGVRAAEDTDFSWRLQRAGWRLELRPEATVEHRYRATVGELRRQWRGYAAGRAWLARRYPDFRPEPAVARGASRAIERSRRPAPTPPPAMSTPRDRRPGFLALDVLLAVEELIGFALSNRASRVRDDFGSGAFVVADTYPVDGQRTPNGPRIDAARRPERIAAAATTTVTYREDDGVAERLVALARLLALHPLRVLADRAAGGPSLIELGPAVRRLERNPRARVEALEPESASVAARIAALAGRRVD